MTWVRSCVRAQPRIPQLRRRCGGDGDMLTEHGAWPGFGSGGLHSAFGGYPVTGVAPGCTRQYWMRFRRMRQSWRWAGPNGVEVDVESDRLIALAPQRADAVMVIRFQGLGDGMREYRMRADLDESRV